MTEFLSNQLSMHTRRAYRCDIKSFFNAFSMDELENLTSEDIAGYRDKLLERLSPSTVARKLTVIRKFFSFCASSELMRYNPDQTVRSPKVSQYSTTNGLTKEQAESLLRQPDKATVMGKRDYAIPSLMLHNGLRNSEVTSICWGDFTSKTIWIKPINTAIKSPQPRRPNYAFPDGRTHFYAIPALPYALMAAAASA